ncbi:MAG: sporulation initiation factor Spo0A C-terminal domain-containing protein [Clostridia bacterium]|nr:sporulation initiation factor Spo0A C-terminal domain-containing protein [Clostridia bacterium]
MDLCGAGIISVGGDGGRLATYVDENYEFIGFFVEKNKAEKIRTAIISALSGGERETLVTSSRERKLSEILNAVGLSGNLSGAAYIKESVRISASLKSGERLCAADIYGRTAEKFHTTPARVERSIRNAIAVAWNRGKIDNFNCVFGKNVFSKYDRPTNAEFIALLTDKIINQ